MKTTTRTNSENAADILGEIESSAMPQEVESGQKMHRTFFEGADPQPNETDEEIPKQKMHGAFFEDADVSAHERIGELLVQIDEGFRADDATNFQKLMIARKYGPLLLELKDLTPHGKFQQTLKERYPKVSYDKCRRWMFLARHEEKVATAIRDYPDAGWGPKKMSDYLAASFEQDSNPEGVKACRDGEEEDSFGLIYEDAHKSDPIVAIETPAEHSDVDSGNNQQPQVVVKSNDSGVAAAQVKFVGGSDPSKPEGSDPGEANNVQKPKPAPANEQQTVRYRATIKSRDKMALNYIEQIAKDHNVPITRKETAKTMSLICNPSSNKIGGWLGSLAEWMEINKPDDFSLTVKAEVR